MAEPFTEPKPSDNTSESSKEQLLVIFIHGFKGTDTTFGSFPARLQHVLSQTIHNTHVECIVFPAYETKGNLNEAVARFADWLTTLTVEKEVASGRGAGSAKVVLCGHSMGGLLAADSLLEFVNNRPDQTAPLWPRIVACLAFDTPYFGLHPFVVKNSATQAFEHVNNIRNVASSVFSAFSGASSNSNTAATPILDTSKALPSPPATASGWAKWAPAAYAVGGAVVAGAAAGTAYWRKDDLGVGYSWATDHMKYVGTLWDEEALKKRVANLIDADEKLGVCFRTFYTILPPTPPVHLLPRTFVVLPQASTKAGFRFLPAKNELALDEVQAHTGMFEARTNDGYFHLGLETARLIRNAVIPDGEVEKDHESKPLEETVTEEMGNKDKPDSEEKSTESS